MDGANEKDRQREREREREREATHPPPPRPPRRRYDHHQRTFTSTMDELGFKTKLSSAGLVYRHYGREVIHSVLKAAGEEVSEADAELLYKDMYKSFIEEVDGIDNGVNAFTGEKNYTVSTTLSGRVGSLNPAWNEESSPAKSCSQFRKAMALTLSEFCGKLEWKVRSVLPARAIVRDAVRKSVAVKSPGGKVFRIAVLKQYCPWKDALYDEEKAAVADEACEVGVAVASSFLGFKLTNSSTLQLFNSSLPPPLPLLPSRSPPRDKSSTCFTPRTHLRQTPRAGACRPSPRPRSRSSRGRSCQSRGADCATRS